MGIMDLLGRKRENQAMAFVDYEHWFFSLREKVWGQARCTGLGQRGAGSV